MARHFAQADRIETLASPAFLESILGEVRSVERAPMSSIGYSGTRFERWRVAGGDGSYTSLVLKHVDPRSDGTVWRTGNIAAREARLLAERGLDPVWDAFEPPYLAFAIEGNVSALLMRDLGPHLFPDVREPISVADEDALVDSLARMHAAFWDSDARALPWLSKTEYVLGFIAPDGIAADKAMGRSIPVYDVAMEGWSLAHQMLPSHLSALLRRPASDLARVADGLPHTLFHGDAKVANFAVLPDGRVAGFDWATMGAGCPALDVGWYLGVNATRLTRSKEQLFADYRARLEYWLGRPLPAATWDAMHRVTILTGASCLLWGKALNVKKKLSGADDEWSWWVTQLDRTGLA